MLKFIKNVLFYFGVFVLLLGVFYAALAFTDAPAGTPPNCPAGYPGCDPPLNVGSTPQTKTGSLTIGTLRVNSSNESVFITEDTYLYLQPVANSHVRLGAWQSSPNGAVPLILQPSGSNVGIGTTNPGKNLTVSSNGNVYMRIEKPSYSDYFDFGIESHKAFIGYTAGTSADSDLYFRTNGSDRMTITDAGNVGIGDTTPLSLLTVGNGDLFRVDTTGNIIRIRDVPYSWPSSQGAASSCLKQTVAGGGNLEWGTCGAGVAGTLNRIAKFTSPTSIGDSIIAESGAELIMEGMNTTGRIKFNETGLTRGYLGYGDAGHIFTNALTDSLSLRSQNALHLGANGDNLIMTIASGNVGIGTTGPESPLHVAPSDSGVSFTNKPTLWVENAGTANNYYVFGATTGGGSTVITNAGNVGIGTTNPGSGYKLDVQGGSINTSGSIIAKSGTSYIYGIGGTLHPLSVRNTAASGAQNYIQLSDNSNYTSYIGQHQTDDYMFFGSSAGSDLVIRGGKVGIGTTNPGTAKLKISGGVLDMSSQKITNVADPVANTDVATRGWVLARSGVVTVSDPNNLGGTKDFNPSNNNCVDNPNFTPYTLSDIQLHAEGWVRISDASLSDSDGDGFKESPKVPAKKLWISSEGHLMESTDPGNIISRSLYKCVFVTSVPYNGDLRGLTGADLKCQNLATAANFSNPSNYKAWLSDMNTNAKDRLTPSTIPYRLRNYTKVADNWTDLIDSSLDNSISITETGLNFNYSVWTGTDPYGIKKTTASDNICDDWTTSIQSTLTYYGYSGAKNGEWTIYNYTYCNEGFCLYCFEQ